MIRKVMFVTAVALLAIPAMAQAQSDTSGQGMDELVITESDLNALTDARIGVVKGLLQLKPDQEKLWAPVEQAIRMNAAARHKRMHALVEKAGQEGEFEPVQLLSDRAAALGDRAAGLKRLADAWKPLYQSLDPDQKKRMQVLAMRVLHELRDAFDEHQLEIYDEQEETWPEE
jgi:hypothetical protein